MTEKGGQLGFFTITLPELKDVVRPKGKFTLKMSTTNKSGMDVFPDEVMWHCAKRECLKCGVSDLLKFALRRHSHINGYSDSYKVTGYTSLKVICRDTDEKVIYYATELMNGNRCYDYALLDFVGNDGSTQSCPSLILSFIRYDITSGIPTPQFIHEQELSLSEIQQNRYIDNSLYAVVHNASDYLPFKQLQNEFVSTFVLRDVITCLYIVKIETIQGPLNLSKDYGATGQDINQLFCTLPRSEWGQYFSSRIV